MAIRRKTKDEKQKTTFVLRLSSFVQLPNALWIVCQFQGFSIAIAHRLTKAPTIFRFSVEEHTYSNPGGYQVVLIVTDAGGQSNNEIWGIFVEETEQPIPEPVPTPEPT